MAVRNKDIKGYEGVYRIYSNGKVWSNYSNKYLSLRESKGYLRVVLYKDKNPKSFSVHRLVLCAFRDNKYNKPVCNHKDGNKKNNNLSNLEWATYSENMQHAIDNGLKIPTNTNKNGLLNGSKNGRSKVTEEIVKIIRQQGKEKRGSKPWFKYNISNVQYYNILNYRSWVSN